ncbi:MAG TPA: hypothetical protein VI319_11280 [Burkholderiales bacterium]
MTLPAKLYLGAAVVLVAGLCAAVAIYLTAGDDPDLSGAYEIIVVDGKPVPIPATQSKAYVRQLQRLGGKASLLFAEMGEWFGSLWRGKQLAITVGWLTLAVSTGLFLLGWWLSPSPAAGKADSSSLRSSE